MDGWMDGGHIDIIQQNMTQEYSQVSFPLALYTCIFVG